jgi:hypothetical protein
MGIKEMCEYQDECLVQVLSEFEIDERSAFINTLFMNIMFFGKLAELGDVRASDVFKSLYGNLSYDGRRQLDHTLGLASRFKVLALELENQVYDE